MEALVMKSDKKLDLYEFAYSKSKLYLFNEIQTLRDAIRIKEAVSNYIIFNKRETAYFSTKQDWILSSNFIFVGPKIKHASHIF